MNPQERRNFPLGFLGSRTVDGTVPTKDSLSALFSRIIHRGDDGKVMVNDQAPEIKEIMAHAEENDLDVVLSPTGRNIVAFVGKGIADHQLFVEIGAAAALIGTAAVLGVIGVVLRKHHRD